jgi:hypothetical protein
MKNCLSYLGLEPITFRLRDHNANHYTSGAHEMSSLKLMLVV